jgi:hypothetical protein
MNSTAGAGSAADQLARQVELLTRQVGHWTAPRWAAPAAAGDASRADLVHRLVQRLADLAADAAGQPRRRVPRLENDLVLPDQLRVMATDLIAANPAPEVLAEAVGEVTAVRRAI